MKLTSQILATFIGGQLEIQNESEGYMYRGEISGAKIGDNHGTEDVCVAFAWVAKADGPPPIPTGWTLDRTTEYKASLEIYSASDIGNGRICINCAINGELAVFFPPGGSKLDRAKIKGLEAVAA